MIHSHSTGGTIVIHSHSTGGTIVIHSHSTGGTIVILSQYWWDHSDTLTVLVGP